MPPRRNVSAHEGSDGGNEVIAPTNAQLAHGLQQLTQLTQALGATLLQNGNGNDVAKKVSSLNPPFYGGQEDPRVLEDWIRAFDKLLDAIGCPADHKVEAAVYYLQQEADIWWVNNGHALSQQPDFDWEAFKDAMRDRFYPEHVKAAMYEEFLHLKQGNLSVQEYHAKFLELARFAPRLVPDEYSKTQKFIRGLNFGIQKVICALDLETLNKAYNKAANLYRVELIEREANMKSRRRMEINEEENKQGYKRPKFNNELSNKGFQNNKGNGGYGGNNGQEGHWQKRNGMERYHYCKRCGNGHPGKDCQGNLVKCFKCQKLGHRAYECHLEQNGNQQGSNGNGGNQRGPRPNNHGTGNRNHNGGGSNGNKNGNNQATDNGGQNNHGGNNNRGRIFVMSRTQAEAGDMVSGDVA
ncbi:PREDICTED: putative mediator of RNA polymerase II transcription subunit 24 [Ipomoea nil]|uniref:putative mediator of RNA polymerase II transcription subunit 24 n=1 Tax=Ipomoea nil TaxID=35883 RepID=UPI000900DFC9|nr:PREDICTED: putative mediator of RNA polymerase II transcription subunit 24 [Ipomoea nil]